MLKSTAYGLLIPFETFALKFMCKTVSWTTHTDFTIEAEWIPTVQTAFKTSNSLFFKYICEL